MTGADHELPPKVRVLSAVTAAQKVADGQESSTFSAPLLVSRPRPAGADQVVPLKVSALPFSSVAAQNAADGQEIEVRPLPSGSTLPGPDHALPL